VRRGKADEPLTGDGYHPIPTTVPALSADTRYPHRKQMAHWRYRPSQHDSDLPTEPVTLIDLPCTPEVPGILWGSRTRPPVLTLAVMSTMSSSTLANTGIRLCMPLIRRIFAPSGETST